MKRFLTTTAIATLMTGAAFADAHAPSPFLDDIDAKPPTVIIMTDENGAEKQMSPKDGDMMKAGLLRGSDLIGKPIYVTTADVSGTQVDTDAMEWDQVGDVNDILLDTNGKMTGILLDIGGFLGMGERQVALDASRLHLVSGINDGNEFYVVFNGTQEQLETAPEYNTDKIYAWTEDKEQMAEQEGDAEISDATRDIYAAPAPDVALDGWAQVRMDELTTEDLTGAVVFDAQMENIGEISTLYVSSDGKLTGAMLDIGGFLGMGEDHVRVDMDSLNIQRDLKEGEVRVYVDVTEEKLLEMKADK